MTGSEEIEHRIWRMRSPAIALLLRFITQEDLPIDWAMTQNNLALALSDRIRGDRAKNLEDAIACYRAALEVRTQGGFTNRLGDDFKIISPMHTVTDQRDRAQNLEDSIACYRAALEVYTQEDLP